jgi:hypothetical protein
MGYRLICICSLPHSSMDSFFLALPQPDKQCNRTSIITCTSLGRENWLAAEADRVLADMCRTAASEARCVAALTAHAGHKSMHVRAKVRWGQ